MNEYNIDKIVEKAVMLDLKHALVDRKGNLLEGNLETHEYLNLFNILAYMFEQSGDELFYTQIKKESDTYFIYRAKADRVFIVKVPNNKLENFINK